MNIDNIILALIVLVVSFAASFPIAVLGYWFPMETDFRGAFRKAKTNKKSTVAVVAVMPVLSALCVLFAPSMMLGVLYAVLTWGLTIIFAVDFRTYEIPFKINVLIFVLGIIRLLSDLESWPLYVIGFFAVSVPLAVIYYVSKGRAIGFGDVKMMAACGMLIGWKCTILALMLGCIVGSVVHILRMKFQDEGAVLAMGPYLAIGVYLSAVFGTMAINAYLTLF